jgi:hypothetical protein
VWYILAVVLNKPAASPCSGHRIEASLLFCPDKPALSSRTLVIFTRLHGMTSQKTIIFKASLRNFGLELVTAITKGIGLAQLV